jgi:Chloroplast import apparatus Tic20-like
MTWRGSTTALDRVFACLPYLIPLLDGLSFAAPFFQQFPALQVVLLPIVPILGIYSLPFVSLIVFFALFLLVVRNENIIHFIRFNAMQAILLSIIVFLCRLIVDYVLGPVLQGGLLIETLYNVVFLGILAAIIYSVAQSVMGRYPEIPTLSDAVHMQVR